MRVIKNNVKWYPWQKDAIRGIFNNPRDATHVIKSRRQTGKSVMCESIILKFAIDAQTFNLYLTPTLKQSRKVFKEIVKAVQMSKVFLKANESLLEIRFVNGSIIQFASAEQGDANLRGYTVSGVLIIDEAAYIPDDIYYSVIPTTDANEAAVVIVSTPKFKTGFFYDLYMQGLGHSPKIFAYNFSAYDTSALLSEEKLAFYKESLPLVKFTQDYLGEFTDIGEGIFGDFTPCLYNQPIYRGEETVMGVDWSSGQQGDDTSITIFNMNKEMLDIIYFNDKDELETINKIVELVRKYNVKTVQVETNSIGQIYYNMLRRELTKASSSVQLKGFYTTNESKQRLVQQLQVAIQNQTVKILRDTKLMTQLGDFVSSLTATGKVTYKGQGYSHDDLVLSTLFAFDLTYVATYSIG